MDVLLDVLKYPRCPASFMLEACPPDHLKLSHEDIDLLKNILREPLPVSVLRTTR